MRQHFSLYVLGALLAVAGAEAAQAEELVTEFSATLTSTTDGRPQAISAIVLKPLGTGPYPAIVIAHDCSGLGPRSSGSPRRWGNLLAGQGYVVIIPDSFTPRGFPDGVCTVTNASGGPALRTTLPLARAVDEFVALDYLRAQPYVEKNHIGLMCGSHGGSTTLATMVDAVNPLAMHQRPAGSGFAAAVALYPGCGARYGSWSVARQFSDHGPVTRYIGVYKPVAPLLILVGEKDDWTPADHCQALAQAAQGANYPVTIKIYPGALHSFDSNFPQRYIAERRNANTVEGRGATTGGDPAAWADAKQQVAAFFGRYLKD
jgi:dienelactone hydrolase